MITVVIPLYNKASSINRAVASVLTQTIFDWEMVVVDDGSNDNGAELVEAFNDSRIRLFKQANAGVAAARNKGVELAKNDFLAFLDADDYWAPTHLENLQLLIMQYPRAALYGTAYFRVGGDGIAKKSEYRNRTGDQDQLLITDYFADVVEFGHFVFTSSVAIKRSWFMLVGGFPLGIKSGEDTLTFARLACAGEVAFSKLATSYYMLPPVAIGERQNYLRRPQCPDYVGIELIKLLEKTPRYKSSLRRYLAHWYRIRAMMFLELNERLYSFPELWKAIRFDRITLKDILCCFLLVLPLAIRRRALARIRKLRGRV
ncbi:glycosyltransferase family 2 protein [Methylomonas sp. OY6]|uniref:Glycosyltransferase family 2 protein n=1 Tax=Methylomonas defluvii TaxID=3045149 RepID=A0ABU4UD93_9GAMM|nr:glycosyltransferase family 2 protein [Methylomonas sp. OY6]MDX8127151.1 glycosyltransferase family 2 protein [Methylomonas sp. OY6]